jgi:proteic killer suppression protein
MAIIGFKHKGLKRLYEDDDARGLPAALAPKIHRMLGALEVATMIEDMGLYPGWRLHRLKGDRVGVWSLTITGNWRLIFKFVEGDAYDLDLVDYH